MRRLRMPVHASWQCPVAGRPPGSPLLCDGFACRGVHRFRHKASTRHRRATMRRLRMPVHASWQRNVSFRSPGHFTLCVIRQQSLCMQEADGLLHTRSVAFRAFLKRFLESALHQNGMASFIRLPVHMKFDSPLPPNLEIVRRKRRYEGST